MQNERHEPNTPADGPAWTSDVADRIEVTVASVRERVVDPVRKLTKGLVFGTLAVGFAAPAVVMAAVMIFRSFIFLANLLPGKDDNAWMAWDLFGLMLVAVGWFLFAKRYRRTN